MRSPQWRMGTQASLVLFVLAFVSFFAIAPQVESKLPFQIMPLEVVNGQVISGSLDIMVVLVLLLVAVVGGFLFGRKIIEFS